MIPDVTPNGVFYLPPTGWLTSFYNPPLKDYYYKMWNAYKDWYRDYDASPKMKIDLEKYDLEDPQNVKTVLGLIDDRLKDIRN